jgi:hypothetical protein
MLRVSNRMAGLAVLPCLALALGPWAATPARAQFLEPDVTVLHALAAEGANDNYGFMAADIGDLDGDGVTEFIIGAPRNAAAGPFAGRAYVYSGATGALLNVVTGSPQNRLGFSVAGVGDVNKDGVPDYAAGGPGRLNQNPPQTGRVVVVSGKDHTVLLDLAGTPQSFFGYDINRAGDVNGDGAADLIVGAPLASTLATFGGRVTVISGADGAGIWSRDGDSVNGSLGTAVSGLTDLNDDGVPEQVVGSSGEVNGHRDSGRAFVMDGASGEILRTLKPSATACDFGDFYAHPSDDVNADGIPDIYVADFCDNRSGDFTGRGYVFSGSSPEKLRVFNGEVAGDSFGAGRPVHDLDGDGAADYIISANLSDAGAADGGKTWLLSGKTGKTLRTFTGTQAGREVGFDALPLGDVNGDGRTDFLLTGLGLAYVVAGDR